jgi:hypothetical protein
LTDTTTTTTTTTTRKLSSLFRGNMCFPPVVTSALFQQRNAASSKRNSSRILMSNRWLCLLAMLLFLPRTAALADEEMGSIEEQFNYFETPNLEWMVGLGDEIRLEQGNAIVSSPYDENKLYITTHTGKLLVRSAADGSSLWSFDPPPPTIIQVAGERSLQQEWTTRCESSVAFGALEGIGQFAVYAVLYDPPPGSMAGSQR